MLINPEITIIYFLFNKYNMTVSEWKL